MYSEKKFISQLIHKERVKRGLTEEEAAEKIGIPRMTFKYWETTSASFKHAAEVEKAFGLKEDYFFDEWLNFKKTNEEKGRDVSMVNEPADTYLAARRKLKTVQKIKSIPFLPIKAQAGYANDYENMQVLDSLPQYGSPPGIDLTGAMWMWIEVNGDSMENTFRSGDILLVSMVPALDWQNINDYYVYVVVTESNVLIKRIFKKSLTEWVMISDNEDLYPQQIIQVSDIKQVWVYRRTFHVNASTPRKFKIQL